MFQNNAHYWCILELCRICVAERCEKKRPGSSAWHGIEQHRCAAQGKKGKRPAVLTMFTSELWDSPEPNIHSETLGSWSQTEQKFPWSLVKPSCIVPWNSSTQNNSISPAPIKNNGKVSSIVSVWARSGPSLEAVCSSRKKRNLCFSLPLHILCLNLETLPISYSQVDGFHKTDLEFKETFPRCLICCSNERVMLAFTWLIKHTFDQGKLIFVNIMHLPQ